MRSKSYSSKVERLDTCEEDEDIGFFDGDINIGPAVASFSFMENTSEPEVYSVNSVPASSGRMMFNNSLRGTTPSINGEFYSVKRGYQFRPSTIRKLFELKARHENINIYINTILDEAINFYYDHVMNKKSS